MNTTSRTISGIVSIVFGLYIMFAVVLDKPEDWVWGLISGIFLIVIGIFIFINKKEDDIEKIKK
jgi:uncharacterized membrane protein HdeD (DUF308 family)